MPRSCLSLYLHLCLTVLSLSSLVHSSRIGCTITRARWGFISSVRHRTSGPWRDNGMAALVWLVGSKPWACNAPICREASCLLEGKSGATSRRSLVGPWWRLVSASSGGALQFPTTLPPSSESTPPHVPDTATTAMRPPVHRYRFYRLVSKWVTTATRPVPLEHRLGTACFDI
ncbi:uncharacterized protein K460DRAFT_156900 [Cucurbitaria berberidis CBS 394.84]|uniref:Secreted protein n=1 Tax=Cucurbitaria berberidis CBS 394.84 TaxID=1168544 RepID=A0A9P4GEN9_9PLEO|nr:uncharacterized protein K460DRAFT_156900 [Cucurbitaria berberidis CBS 394.84]KAF1844064.1 hypothetical protein K460DRAFT_156900 [Cucurbitaria berberidis CBS 394.84]